MNSENSKTCDPYRLIENLPEKKQTQNQVINMLLYQMLAYIHMEKYKNLIQKQA